jgi:O-antigen/teichoic acid export membrane protein
MTIRRNTIYNLIGQVLPIGVSMVTIPIYLNVIGEARYGVLAVAWLLLGYFGLFDLGLSRATAQHIAALRDARPSERAQIFWTALSLNVGLGVLGGLLIWPIASYFFGNVFKIEDALHPEMQAAVPWLILAVPLATLSGVLTGGLQGRERFLELNLISVTGTVLFQFFPLAAAMLYGANLGVVLPAALLARLCTLLVLFYRCRQNITLGHSVSFVRSKAMSLLHFGGWVTISSIVGPLMTILDRFIIGSMIGAKAVTYYTIPYQLGERSTMASSSLTSALFPRLSAASDEDRLRLANESLRVIVVIMLPVMVAAILIVRPFFSWWINPDFANQSANIAAILLIGFFVNSLAFTPSAKLQAKKRPDLNAKCHMAEVIPYLALLYFGLKYFGLIGAAIVFSLRVTADYFLLSWLAGMHKNALKVLLSPSVFLALAILIATQSVSASMQWFILSSGLLAASMIWAWLSAPLSIKSFIHSQVNKFSFVRKS